MIKIIQWAFLALLIPATLWISYNKIDLYLSSDLYDAEIVSCKGKQVDITGIRNRHKTSTSRKQFQYAPVAISSDRDKGIGNYWLSSELCKRTIGNKVKILVKEGESSTGAIYSYTHFWLAPLVLIVFTLLFLVFGKSKLFNRLLLISFAAVSAYFLAKEYNYISLSESDTQTSTSSQLNPSQPQSNHPIHRCIRTSLTKENVTKPEEISRLACKGLNIRDLSALAPLQNLERLQLQNNKLTSLETMPLLPNLKEIHLSGMKSLTSLKGVSNLPNLEALVANKSGVVDISDLTALGQLQRLELLMNQVSDISSLEKLDKLTSVTLNYNPITSVDSLAEKPSLKKLQLHRTHVESITPLYGNTKLEVLGVSGAEGADCDQFDILQGKLSAGAKIFKHKYCTP